ncbi:MAG: aminotransferase class I/II-fold pyridoxal phosphate-dependent enzyme [Bacteroidaceae bacterium]|nr:aminotransferase class I/II-fold pyridoxal phosphate-dependent enzyme [Bacteroidaceae bacterium]
MKTSFESDYNNGAHPLVLQHLIDTNTMQSQSYGFDTWSEQARHKIRTACQCPEADIFFLVGGTQTNATVIDGMLQTYEGVIAVQTAHINVHESGAVEASGHKVITLPSHAGKMDAGELEAWLKAFNADPTLEHMVIPGMVYITFPTELGSVYTAKEIEEILSVCQRYDLKLFIDGARLGYGLASSECDFNLSWLAHHCDAFYIGGTKVGALCGEAVVFPRGNAPRHFMNIVKRHGALLAKSRLAGVQFDALFTDNLYLNIAQHAISMAMKVRQLFTEAGIPLRNSSTNQQFVELTNRQMEQLMQGVLFETWEPIDANNNLCRFVTSWATTEEDLQALKSALETL